MQHRHCGEIADVVRREDLRALGVVTVRDIVVCVVSQGHEPVHTPRDCALTPSSQTHVHASLGSMDWTRSRDGC
jgi:hypothetical protein